MLNYPQRRRQEVFEAIKTGTCTLQKIRKVQEDLGLRACRSKLKYTEEEAARNLYRYEDPSTSVYLCPLCGWLHVTHEQKWVKSATRIVVAQQEAKKRNPKTKTPKWKLDPRRSND